jgi:hypothetical protein
MTPATHSLPPGKANAARGRRGAAVLNRRLPPVLPSAGT